MSQANSSNTQRTDSELAQAIAAVKAKQWTHARALLSELLKREPDNAQAWLWLSASLSDPLDQERCLTKVLELEPNHPLATQGLQVARNRIVEALYQQARIAMDNRQYAQARDTLLQLVDRDQDNLQAWIWLSKLVETADEQEICFENILTLDPENNDAQQGLNLLQQAREEAEIDPTAVMEINGQSDDEYIAPTLAGDILGDGYREKFTTVIPEPEPEPESYTETRWTEVFTDTLNCPYCTTKTEYEDRRCPVCEQPLWQRSHQNPKRSSDIMTLFILQAASAIILLVVPILMLVVIGFQLDMNAPTDMISVYLGNSEEVDAAIIEQAYDILPRALFWLSWLPAMGSIALAIGIYIRWRPVFYILMGSAVVSFFSSIASLARFSPGNWLALAVGLLGLALSIMYVIFVIKLEPDFAYRRKRILLELDTDLKDGVACLRSGKYYASQGQWAKAALHFRRATVLSPKVTDGYRALASTCMQLNEWKLARTALETALPLAPNDERITTRLERVKAHLHKTE